MISEEEIVATAKAQYEAGTFDVPLIPARCAVLVIDMIDEFVRPQWSPFWIPDATRQAPVIRRLVDVCRATGALIVHLAYDVSRSLHGGNFPRSEFMVPIGAMAHDRNDLFQAVRFWPETAPQPEDTVVLKHCYSGFHETPLDTILRNHDVETVIITGTMTNFCCGATAREAFWHGYFVVMAEDCCSTDIPALHRAEIATLRRGYARIMTHDQIIAEFQKTREDGM